jgi:hypothetical protein
VSARSILLTIWVGFWVAALIRWRRRDEPGGGRSRQLAWLFLALGAPFLLVGIFYTSSSYPDELGGLIPTPAPEIDVYSTPEPEPAPIEEPAPPANSRAFAAAVEAAQRAAVARYPELGVVGSGFNAEFVQLYRRRKAKNPAFFQDSAVMAA